MAISLSTLVEPRPTPTVSRTVAMQFLRFSLVGAMGFLVDAGVLTLAIRLPGINLYTGRIVSFLAAVTSTWAMNRTYTFKTFRPRSWPTEWLRFTAANAVGGLVNFGTYAWIVHVLSLAYEHPAVGVAAGSLSGLLVNFSLSKCLVFRERPAGLA